MRNFAHTDELRGVYPAANGFVNNMGYVHTCRTSTDTNFRKNHNSYLSRCSDCNPRRTNPAKILPRSRDIFKWLPVA